MKGKCDICDGRTTVASTDSIGRTYEACKEHAKYLNGWIRDAECEMNSESAAARMFEEASYGRPDGD